MLLSGCLAGYIWLGISLASYNPSAPNGPEICLFKKVTHVPCPSCGSTRSVMAMIHGDWGQAMLINPFGFIIAVILCLGPLWAGYDLLFKRQTMWTGYIRAEKTIRKKAIAIPLILLAVINWAWTMMKAL